MRCLRDNWFQSSATLCAVCLIAPLLSSWAEIRLEATPKAVEAYSGGVRIAQYAYADPNIPRPYFAHIRALDGTQVTRNHPPIEGDLNDHPEYHPGIWMAFGDISGADFWRNKARVRVDEVKVLPTDQNDRAAFEARQSYLQGEDLICTESCRYAFVESDSGYFLVSTSTFTNPEKEFVFGDQEEMGLGIRMATPFAVTKGGTILNSEGDKNEDGAWGKQADWCAYWGETDGKTVGAVIIPGPRNFRKSWFHARDYGLLLANPFGHKAFTGGEASAIRVAPGESLTLQFAVFIFSGDAPGVEITKKAYTLAMPIFSLFAHE